MVKQNSIKIFEEKKVRTVWDSEQEEWYFSVVDVVAVLTESPNPSDYLKKVKKRDEELAKGWGQIVTPLSIPTNGGNQRTNCANLKGNLPRLQILFTKHGLIKPQKNTKNLKD